MCWIRLPRNDFKMTFRWIWNYFWLNSKWFYDNFIGLVSLKLYNQTQTRRQDIHWEKGWEMLCVLNKAAAAGTHWRQPRFTSTVLTAFCEHFDAPVAQCTKIKNSNLKLLLEKDSIWHLNVFLISFKIKFVYQAFRSPLKIS